MFHSFGENIGLNGIVSLNIGSDENPINTANIFSNCYSIEIDPMPTPKIFDSEIEDENLRRVKTIFNIYLKK